MHIYNAHAEEMPYKKVFYNAICAVVDREQADAVIIVY